MSVRTISAPKLVASVLPADFAELGRDVEQIDKAGIDRIQWDVMDGSFVPNLTFGPDVIAANRGRTPIGFEAHLMVDDPDPMLHRWVDAGCQIVIVHAEACRHLHRTLSHIRDLGALAGVALNPATPLDAVVNVLDVTDLLLVMTVNPRFRRPTLSGRHGTQDRRGARRDRPARLGYRARGRRRNQHCDHRRGRRYRRRRVLYRFRIVQRTRQHERPRT